VAEYGRLRDSEYFRTIIDYVEEYFRIREELDDLLLEKQSVLEERNLITEEIASREEEYRTRIREIDNELNRIYNRFTRGLKITKPPKNRLDERLNQLKRLLRAWVAYAYRAARKGKEPTKVNWRSRAFYRELLSAAREARKKYGKRRLTPEDWVRYRIPSIVYYKYFGSEGRVTVLLNEKREIISSLNELLSRRTEILGRLNILENRERELRSRIKDIVESLIRLRFNIYRVKLRYYNIPKHESDASPTGMFQGFYDVIAVINEEFGEVIQDWWFFNEETTIAGLHMLQSFNMPLDAFDEIDYVFGHEARIDGLEELTPELRKLILGYADIAPEKLDTIPDKPIRLERLMVIKNKKDIDYNKPFIPELIVESDIDRDIPEARAEIETLRDTVEEIIERETREEMEEK